MKDKLNALPKFVPPVGLEPTTSRLRAASSTN